MDKPLIHPKSELTISFLIKNPPQSLLLTGPTGVGLTTIAKYIAKNIGNQTIIILPEKDKNIDIAKGKITVASIRRLYNQTRTIQKGRRVIIIDFAERMGVKAQNAFLKLLEEPGEGTYFILATHTPSSLLPTITSRTQSLELRPISRSQTDTYLNELGISDPSRRLQLLFMADRLPAELFRLTHDETYFLAKAQIVRDARDLLQATTYKKLLVAHKYRENREDALLLLVTASDILRRSITNKPQASLIAQIDGLLYAYQQIKANGNIRLCLTRLVL